jgi:hypothetical protein
LEIAKLASVKLVDVIFQEAPFIELFQKLYHTPDWVDGSATGSILATLNDYFQDYERFIEPSNFKRQAVLAFLGKEGVYVEGETLSSQHHHQHHQLTVMI